jgi:electron transfer flavoprotein beta subunit
MKIVVAIAGVLDPKWPIELDRAGVPRIAPDRVVMSPFDESALEIALRLRDMDPEAISIAAIVLGDRIARIVAAFRIEDIAILTLPFAVACDPNGAAAALAAAIPRDAGLVLMGREFGDCDDGAVAPLLAARLGLPFLARVQDVRTGPALLREAQADEESVALAAPMLSSVTNDRRNRLRKPLMKNVMAARTARFRSLAAAPPETPPFEQFACVVDARRPVSCRMVEGTSAAIAAILADHMRASVAP